MEASLLMPKKKFQEFSPKIWWRWHRKGLWRPGFITGAIIHSVVAVRKMLCNHPKVFYSRKNVLIFECEDSLWEGSFSVWGKRNIWSCHKGIVFLFFDKTVEISKSHSTFLLYLKQTKEKMLMENSDWSLLFSCPLSLSVLFLQAYRHFQLVLLS